VLAVADRLGWPVLADPRSGCRVDHPGVVAAADAVLRSAEVAEALLPEVVLCLGDGWASKVLAGFVRQAAAAGAQVVAVDPWWRWADPDRVVTDRVVADPGRWLAEATGGLPAGPTGEWRDRWRRVEVAAQAAIDRAVATDEREHGHRLTEPGVARRLLGWLPAGSTVVAASSMPVRDLEWYAPPMARPPVVLANRGANGIDGVASTAQGVAAAAAGPVVGLLGDLAFLHDVSSLVRSTGGGAGGAGCTLLVVDNGGGGIFSFLPQAAALAADRFEQLFGTPQAPDVAEVAAGFGLEVADVDTAGRLQEALAARVGHGGLAVVRARVPGRVENVAVHDRIHRAVAEAAEAAYR